MPKKIWAIPWLLAYKDGNTIKNCTEAGRSNRKRQTKNWPRLLNWKNFDNIPLRLKFVFIWWKGLRKKFKNGETELYFTTLGNSDKKGKWRMQKHPLWTLGTFELINTKPTMGWDLDSCDRWGLTSLFDIRMNDGKLADWYTAWNGISHWTSWKIN